jgi:hypothetical protein
VRSSLIGKIEKAKLYAQEPDRITLSSFNAQFRGENDNYTLSYTDGEWKCSCHFFSQWGVCSHIMAIQQILTAMLPEEAFTSTAGSQV